MQNVGLVTLKTVAETAWLGQHTIKFEVFLLDFDPSAEYAHPLEDFELHIEIMNPYENTFCDASSCFDGDLPPRFDPIEAGNQFVLVQSGGIKLSENQPV